MMRRLCLLVVGLALLLSGCARHVDTVMAPTYERQRARDALSQADLVVVGILGKPGAGYWEGDLIYTDYSFTVDRAEKGPAGATVTIKMRGGTVVDPQTGLTTESHVDFVTPMPTEGDEVFLVLRKEGEAYGILDAMVLKEGLPVHARPANSVYLPVLKRLN